MNSVEYASQTTWRSFPENNVYICIKKNRKINHSQFSLHIYKYSLDFLLTEKVSVRMGATQRAGRDEKLLSALVRIKSFLCSFKVPYCLRILVADNRNH